MQCFWKIVPNWWFCIKEEGFLALCNPFKLIYKKKFILIELANFILHGFLSEQIELQIEFLVWDLCIMRCSTIFNTLLSPKNLVACKTGQDKCFMCVTKTISNLTTYSRKPGDYNGTIIFEIDIMKNSSPLNLIFTFFAMSKPK